ncbi:hypothetical protein M441DRAFT_173355 [Trichoderma asperellum CBS 433.97]|uniref:Uncharacterized protein n=1 Tax=Trichoderma asperellum (strain ATCC 204424 / CBS 433.97 / NBRC 101777) TaxID=1042311 RepID=A0A2T3YZL3_TRIA4|nr:hypothetical protein M441DRAFT_173355 [Trichoderma asperellum CBS 433.97]PTB37944.1 hypothetical protein M441DRAFT_173355 [Trichoderma asperellum CBS 433.97]
MASNNFIWINPTTTLPVDRAKTRRDIMQKVAQKRKAEPKYRHPNSRQLPLFIPRDDLCDSSAKYKESQTFNVTKRHAKTKSEDVFMRTDTTYLRTLTPTYSTVLAKTNLHFIDLSLLTSVGVGRYTGQRLLESPQIISHFFKGRNWSYFQYIPLHYQQNVLIRSATDCVLARVRWLLAPDDRKWEFLALSCYSRALSKLQDAIHSTSQHITAEVLCATLTLGLYELLNPSREDAWMKHTAGATYIIKLRGPQNYTSEFEKCLFMGHVGPMATEAILNNETCFLDHPAWKATLLSIITDDPLVPERSTMVISIVLIFVTIPTLFKRFTDVICHKPDEPLQIIKELISRAQELRVSLQGWYHKYIQPSGVSINDLASGNMYYDALIIYYICMIYSSRLNTCIHLQDTPGIYKLEEECQRFARIIVSLHQSGESSSNHQRALLLAQKLPIAEATIQSGDAWKTQLSLGYSYNHIFKMPREKFDIWCKLFGRSTL